MLDLSAFELFGVVVVLTNLLVVVSLDVVILVDEALVVVIAPSWFLTKKDKRIKIAKILMFTIFLKTQ